MNCSATHTASSSAAPGAGCERRAAAGRGFIARIPAAQRFGSQAGAIKPCFLAACIRIARPAGAQL